MKRTKTLLGSSVLALVLAISLVSCGGSTKDAKADLERMLKEAEEAKNATRTVKSDSLKIEIDLPLSMIETDKLDDADVPFQYYNAGQELYIMGFRENLEIAELALKFMDTHDESKKMDENYMNFTLAQMTESGSKIIEKTDMMKIKAKNAEGIMMRIDATVPGILDKVSYWIACFEVKGFIHKYIFWTQESKKDEVEKMATKAFKSIKFN